MTRYRSQAKNYLCPARRKGKRVGPPDPYRSWLEADVAHGLKKAKVPFEYETETIIYVEPAQTRRYTPDIILGRNKGAKREIIVEVKGRWTAQDRRKMSLVIEQNPQLDIRMLFARDNTISKNSRTKYSTWCAKRDIKFAIGTSVPQEWLEELT
jgi:hypothetical protein